MSEANTLQMLLLLDFRNRINQKLPHEARNKLQ
jgi:hypothetical protein